MNRVTRTAQLDFEIYLLMTMRIRLVNRRAAVEAKLAEIGLTVEDAGHIHARVTDALGDEKTRFNSINAFLGGDPYSSSLKYESELWPGFEFTATADKAGLLQSAQYSRRIVGNLHQGDSPLGLPPWSTDVREFTQNFGPMTNSRRWPLFDPVLPAYEEYEFFWNGERCGAGFSWGLFLYAAQYWPED